MFAFTPNHAASWVVYISWSFYLHRCYLFHSCASFILPASRSIDSFTGFFIGFCEIQVQIKNAIKQKSKAKKQRYGQLVKY